MPVVKKQKTATPLSILPPARNPKRRQGLLLPASRDFFLRSPFNPASELLLNGRALRRKPRPAVHLSNGGLAVGIAVQAHPPVQLVFDGGPLGCEAFTRSSDELVFPANSVLQRR